MSTDKQIFVPPPASRREPTDGKRDLDRTVGLPECGPGVLPSGNIGPYRLKAFLGRGGAGIVYHAEDADGMDVALKVMTETPAMTRHEIIRFLKEAETAKRLRRHPHIVTVYDTGQDGLNHYIAMELVSGGRTFDQLVGTKLPVTKVLDLVIPVAEALVYAHGSGIIHRDLKPGNVLINEFDQPLLADFGLAKSETAEKLTITGTIMGTPRYMAPEQCGFGDGDVTRQADIYAFGLIVYELLTGVSPYPITAAMELPEIFRLICQHEPRPPRRLRPEIGRNLNAVVMRMIEKEKPLRYKEMSTVYADLDACREGRAVSVRGLSLAERWEKAVRRNAIMAISIAATATVAALLYYLIVLPGIREKTYAQQTTDVATAAAKRRVAQLEREIESLRHPGAREGGADSVGQRALLAAREALTAGLLDEAAVQFAAARAWASLHDHQGIVTEADGSLARIALAQGDHQRAATIFRQLANNHGRDSLTGLLAHFEMGAALWLEQRPDEATAIWREILTFAPRSSVHQLDSGGAKEYVAALVGLALDHDHEANAGQTAQIASLPRFFQGLGYWALAQSAPDATVRAALMADAREHRGIFIWIR